MTERKIIGVFGGTFDPVHIGHLRVALELKTGLGFDEMRLLPCHRPPHRESPGADSQDRASMVRLALSDCPQLSIDERELHHSGPSYTVDTLVELRAELGKDVSLCLAIGMDALLKFDTWHRWLEIFELAHVVVVARPGWQQPESGPVAKQLLQRAGTLSDLKGLSCGKIFIQQQTLLPISSTGIRRQIRAGESPQFLIPDVVWHYILEHHLYVGVK